MGLFDIFKKRTKIEQEVVEEKKKSSTVPLTINLKKSQENLGKVLIDLSKGTKVDLSKHKARVAMAIDYSGSMGSLYANGSIQKVITRLLPIALKFDDNGELESWIFSNGSCSLTPVCLNNYDDYVKKVINKSEMYMGGTNYSPVLEEIIELYQYNKISSIPAFVIFITDGDNWDTTETDKIIRELSNYNIFIQFVGIGKEKFTYLRKLDNLSGRRCDNTGFIAVEDMNNLSDIELYTELLRQYKEWLEKK